MALPEDMRVSPGVKETIATKVKGLMSYFGLIGSSEGEAKSANLKALSSYDMRAQCLFLYLDKYKHVFLSDFSDEMTLTTVVNDVHLIFDSLIKVKFTYRKKPNDRNQLESRTRDTRLMKKVLTIIFMHNYLSNSYFHYYNTTCFITAFSELASAIH